MNTPSPSTNANAFEHPIRIYWEDTDAGGIVFYANYLKFFERARTEWLRALGFGQQVLRDQSGGMFVVSETAVKYHSPARLDDTLVVTAELQSGGKASLTIAQRAYLRTPGQTTPSNERLLAEGTIRLGWVDSTTLKPGRIPAPVLEALK
ncbi:YbgC/FadM family acyl-CoA thioesterase [uncultured Limnohabitans sp.]|jgi:acyl-CoA thioester hydrolase|uniref:YbgC/FadM family acyl-CoA thioesterase n=1 Tax=uncultured Limnohabitans sp. TaxID=768543 RepID=UPI002608507E|nr:YbgC/FadM family acyl-CoA thioesterase [uncultured Limnohabitans sp.]